MLSSSITRERASLMHLQSLHELLRQFLEDLASNDVLPNVRDRRKATNFAKQLKYQIKIDTQQEAHSKIEPAYFEIEFASKEGNLIKEDETGNIIVVNKNDQILENADKERYDIFFLYLGASGSMPEDMTLLKSEFEKTLDILRQFYSNIASLGSRGRDDYQTYLDDLKGLAEYGLEAPNPQPKQAMESLRIIQARFVERQKANLIAKYMANLGLHLIGVLGVAEILLCLASSAAVAQWCSLTSVLKNAPYLAILPALFVGIVFSSFLRCRTLTFYEVLGIDTDKFTPTSRAVFALALTAIAAIFLKAKVLDFSFGGESLSTFDMSLSAALTFGAICGLAQEAIASMVLGAANKLPIKK